MNITIGSDHGAVALKEEVKMVLKEYEDIKVTDVGTFGTTSVDYPDIAEKVCADVVSGKADRALCNDVYSAKMSRQHNNANVLAMGGRVLGFGPAGEIVRAWVEGEFEGGRHERRINKIAALEEK